MGDRSATWSGAEESSSQRRFTICRFETVDSTNRWVLEAARSGAPDGLVAVADHQTGGRGRRGRTWAAPPGSSLLASVLVRPTVSVDRIHLLTMAGGLALADAVGAVAGFDASLKWPNDLVVGDRKLAGLLAEADISGTGVRDAVVHSVVHSVVLGVGCNVSQLEFPAELARTATSCALEAGRAVDRDAVLGAFLEHLGGYLDALDSVALAYRARLATLGRVVRVDLGHDIVEGTALGVDDAGRLEVEVSDGSRVAVAVGDVVHVRPA